MNHRPLGKTGLRVSELGLGGLFLASTTATLDEARRTVRRAIDCGINYIDTAPGYRDSEVILGQALEGIADPYFLSTKLGGRPEPFDPQNKAQLYQSIEQSLHDLNRSNIDILFIHEPDRPGQYEWFSDPLRYHGPVCEVLDELKAQGIIRFTGLAGTTAYEMARLVERGDYDVVLTAFNYSLLWQEAVHEVLPVAKQRGMGVIVGSPLQQGALARRYDNQIERDARWLSRPRREQYRALYALLDQTDIALPELALRFVLSSPDVATVLTGARSVAELELNIRAAEKGPLPEDILRRIEEIAAMVPYRPFEEPFVLPFGQSIRHHAPGKANRDTPVLRKE